MTKEVKFKNPSFAQRIKGMLGVDFYRLFHTPMFYIFLGIAAIIPALVSMVAKEPLYIQPHGRLLPHPSRFTL